MIRHGFELENVEHPAVLGKAAILASQVPACRTQAYTLRAVSNVSIGTTSLSCQVKALDKSLECETLFESSFSLVYSACSGGF